MRRWLALELAGTIRHDGTGGVADDLTTAADLSAWIETRRDLLGYDARFPVDERALDAVLHVRTAVRALLARTVAPAPPSRADANRLPTAADALTTLNRAAARVPATLSLDWPAGQQPSLRFADETADPIDQLTSILARESMVFLTDADSGRLAACNAPRCVRYFLKEHGRQEYCKPSCSNRARAARHYQRQQRSTEATSGTVAGD